MKTLLTSTALVAMLATSATATNSLTSTNTVDWKGNSNSGGIDTVECTFISNTDGTMTFNEGDVADPTDDVWTTTQPAQIQVLVRNGYGNAAGANVLNTSTTPSHYGFKYALDYILVEPANHAGDATQGGFVGTLDGSVEIPADVDYLSPAYGWPGTQLAEPTVTTPAGINGSENIEIVPGNADQSGIYTFEIGGTATMDYANANDRLDANTEYKVRHLVTCMQNGTDGIWVNGVDADDADNDTYLAQPIGNDPDDNDATSFPGS